MIQGGAFLTPPTLPRMLHGTIQVWKLVRWPFRYFCETTVNLLLAQLDELKVWPLSIVNIVVVDDGLSDYIHGHLFTSKLLLARPSGQV